MEPDQFCWNTTDCIELKSLKQSLWSSTDEPKKNNYFNQNFCLIVITTTFLLNTLDVEVLFLISFIGLYVELAKVLWNVIAKNLKNCKIQK